MKIFFLVVMLLGNLGDAISTYFAAKVIGIQGELNPVLRGLMRTIGVLPSMLLKIITLSILAFLIYPARYSVINLIIGVPYCLATYVNFRKIKAALKRRALDQKGGLR